MVFVLFSLVCSKNHCDFQYHFLKFRLGDNSANFFYFSPNPHGKDQKIKKLQFLIFRPSKAESYEPVFVRFFLNIISSEKMNDNKIEKFVSKK